MILDAKKSKTVHPPIFGSFMTKKSILKSIFVIKSGVEKSEDFLYLGLTVKQSEEIESHEVSAMIGNPDESSKFIQKRSKIR